MRDVILLTAALEPRGVPTLQRSDWQIRRMDYVNALNFYCRTATSSAYEFLIAEGTGADVGDLVSLCERFGHKVSVVKAPAAIAAASVGKGNAEAVLFNAAAAQLAATTPPRTESARVIKVTGRLIVRNWRSAIEHMPESGRFVSGKLARRLNHFDTKFFACDALSFSDFFTGLQNEVDEMRGRHLENVCAPAVAAAVGAGASWIPIRRIPRITGVSGSTGVKYGSARDRIIDASTYASRLVSHRYASL